MGSSVAFFVKGRSAQALREALSDSELELSDVFDDGGVMLETQGWYVRDVDDARVLEQLAIEAPGLAAVVGDPRGVLVHSAYECNLGAFARYADATRAFASSGRWMTPMPVREARALRAARDERWRQEDALRAAMSEHERLADIERARAQADAEVRDRMMQVAGTMLASFDASALASSLLSSIGRQLGAALSASPPGPDRIALLVQGINKAAREDDAVLECIELGDGAWLVVVDVELERAHAFAHELADDKSFLLRHHRDERGIPFFERAALSALKGAQSYAHALELGDEHVYWMRRPLPEERFDEVMEAARTRVAAFWGTDAAPENS